MYKILFLLFISLFIIGCGGPGTTADTAKSDSLAVDSNILMIGNVKFEVSPSSKEEFEKYPSTKRQDDNREEVIDDTAAVHRMGDSLCFILKEGKRILKNHNDSLDESSVEIYTYLYSDDQHGFWIVDKGYYEWGSNVLVNQISGDTLETYSEYAFSPDKRFIFAIDNSLMGDGGGAQLFEIKNGKHYHLANDAFIWVGEEVKWIKDKTILVKTNSADQGYKYFKLIMK